MITFYHFSTDICNHTAKSWIYIQPCGIVWWNNNIPYGNLTRFSQSEKIFLHDMAQTRPVVNPGLSHTTKTCRYLPIYSTDVRTARKYNINKLVELKHRVFRWCKGGLMLLWIFQYLYWTIGVYKILFSANPLRPHGCVPRKWNTTGIPTSLSSIHSIFLPNRLIVYISRIQI